MIPDLKLKWDASEGKTVHDGALVLIGFMWPLSVLSFKDHMNFKSFILTWLLRERHIAGHV